MQKDRKGSRPSTPVSATPESTSQPSTPTFQVPGQGLVLNTDGSPEEYHSTQAVSLLTQEFLNDQIVNS